jgi:transposase-like protein
MQSPYDPELRAEICQRMSPPNRESVAEIARSTGVNAQTLYSWRHRWKQEGPLIWVLIAVSGVCSPSSLPVGRVPLRGENLRPECL